ncbi:MAG: hypothetical protein MUO53_12850 [Maribacter sp.]|nr:hypothetical protein [Maribacter sp.]
MEKIYTNDQSHCKLIKSKRETVAFLLNYSKSLKIIQAKDLQFESNMN